MPMFWFALLCGWGLTAALIALIWIRTRPGRRLLTGLALGIAGGLLWPVTVWVAIGAAFYARASRASGSVPAGAAEVEAQVQQALAFARQAEIEGMTTSAEYWRAEVQRLSAQQPAQSPTHPAATSMIVLACTVASLTTIGGLWLASPSPEAASAVAAPLSLPVGPFVPAPPLGPAQDEPVRRTALGNIAKQYGEAASVVGNDGGTIAEFTIGSPAPASCNPYAQDPINSRFIQLPVTLKTFDDPADQLLLLHLASPWEYVRADGRSLEASTTAAGSCSYDSPMQLGPNRTYEFAVVLDVPDGPGTLVLSPPAFGDGGWEWAYAGS
jgi:hypothetical protein